MPFQRKPGSRSTAASRRNRPVYWALAAALWLPTALLAAVEVSYPRADGALVHARHYPVAAEQCQGIAVISHGAGGSETGYAYLAEALQQLGYQTLVPGHAESGTKAWRAHTPGLNLKQGLVNLLADGQAFQARLDDLRATLAWPGLQCAGSRRILLGHSMGAATVMMEAGAENQFGLKGQNRFDTYVALSPQGVGAIFPEQAWRHIERPMLMLTGTRDDEIGGESWQTRTDGFSRMPAGCKWLGVVEGATHSHFAGHGASRKTEAATLLAVRAFLQQPDRRCLQTPDLQGLTLQVR